MVCTQQNWRLRCVGCEAVADREKQSVAHRFLVVSDLLYLVVVGGEITRVRADRERPGNEYH